MRTKEGQAKHDAEVARQARMLINAGWRTVFADLPNLARPPKVGSFIPDVYANHGAKECIVEVETLDSINSDQAKQQKAAFQAWAVLSPINRTFKRVLA